MVDAAVIGKNKTTHIHTIQMPINAAGKFVVLLFLVLQESAGKFNPIYMQKLENIHTKLVY